MADVTFEGVTKQFGKDVIAVDSLNLQVADGELLVLVGPSGCGKSTTLRMLAGLEDITGGHIAIGDRVVNELTPKERDIAMVFQSYALYPHLSVADNLGYPLRLARMSKQDRATKVLAVAKQLRLEDLLDRKPRQLSGGQRQRVAMGRAMVRDPKVFLMDEPLSNLDAKLRVLMRSEVAELQRNLGTTMFYVTHDQVEAMTMGDRVAIMDKGVLQQVDAPAELYRNPANLFVAGFIGSPPMNLINGVLADEVDGSTTFTSGNATFALAPDTAHLDRTRGATDAPVVVGLRPEHVRLDSDLVGVRATVALVEMLGSESLVHLVIDGMELHTADLQTVAESGGLANRIIAKVHDGDMVPRPGHAVGVSFMRRDLHVFDAATGRAFSTVLALA